MSEDSLTGNEPQPRKASSGRTTVSSDLFDGTVDVRSFGITVLALLAVFYTLYLGRDLFQPLVLACLLTFLLRPVVRILKRARIPELLGSGVTLAVLLAGVGYGIYQLSGPAEEWLDEASQHFAEIAFKLRPITEPVQEAQRVTKEVEQKLTDMTKGEEKPDMPGADPQRVMVQDASLGETLLLETQQFLLKAVTMIVFLFLLLASGDSLLRKLVSVLPRLEEKKAAVDIMRQIEGDISAYLITITFINIGVGVTVGLGMAVIGLPNPLLWGVMAALLNYIPYLGALFGVVAVSFVALLTFDHMASSWLPALFYLCVNVLEAYVVTPFILGRRLTLNPIVIFVWLLIWGWIWGIPGALMAVPLLAVVKIFCDRLALGVGELLGS